MKGEQNTNITLYTLVLICIVQNYAKIVQHLIRVDMSGGFDGNNV